MGRPAERSDELGATCERVPDFFLVGSPKTGTTSLYRMLRAHPQIYMPDLKEPRYLASDMRPRPERAHEPREVGYPLTLEEYLALFDQAGPEQRVGEASTFYLWSRDAAGRIAELQPDARIVAILREPAGFLRSMHTMFLQWGVETERDLGTALSLEAARRRGRRVPRLSHRPQLLQYAEHVRYVEQLSRYEARFSPEQILVLIYDDFQHDNEATVRRVLRFLDVDEGARLDLVQANVTRQTVRSPRTRHLLKSVSKGTGPVARSTKTAIKGLTTRRLRRNMLRSLQTRVLTSAPPPDESLMVELRRRFEPEVLALSEYLDRDLVSLWGYDDIA